MQAKLLSMCIGQLLKLMPQELVKEFMDSILDKVEDKILGTASKIDDALVLPIIRHIRNILDIPDND